MILSTIPPRHGFAAKAAAFAEVARKVARELSVPLVDYHAEILKRRPDDWDGAADDFRAFEGYDVPTLLARDGVHPSAPRRYQDDYSEKALRNHGYGLRNYLVLMKYAEVIDRRFRRVLRRPTARTDVPNGIGRWRRRRSSATQSVVIRRLIAGPGMACCSSFRVRLRFSLATRYFGGNRPRNR